MIYLSRLGGLILALAFSVALAQQLQQQTKISLNTSNILQVYGVQFFSDNATALLDEQEVAGNPAGGTGGKCVSPWTPTWDATWYGAQLHPMFVIDLFQEYTLSSIWLYRGWGTWGVSVDITNAPADRSQAIESFAWSMGNNTPTGQGWVSYNFSSTSPVTARYVSVAVNGPSGSSFLEFVLYGQQASSSVSSSSSSSSSSSASPSITNPLPRPQLADLLGTNGFALDSMQNLSGVIGAMREYQDWDWIEHVQDQNAFQPTDENDFFLDFWYTNLTQIQVKTHTCWQKPASWIHGNNQTEEAWKPLTDAQLAIPLSAMNASYYEVIASHAYQVAARYGSVSVPLANLKLAAGQPKLTGLNLLTGLEIWNEVDGTWNGGRNGFFASFEYAAMLSAAYDGHEGTLGTAMGVKAADPNFNVIHSGLAGLSLATAYFEGVRLWSTAFRKDKKFPADTLNVHTYCRNAAGSQGIAPELCNLDRDLLSICAYRDTTLPTLPLWLSEFGYDTVGGPSFAPPIGAYTSQEVQAMWLIRTVLLLARLVGSSENNESGGTNACISRAQMYMLADVESKSGGVFATSGLLASSDFGYAPKVSWYYYSMYTQRLGNFTFAGMVNLTQGEGNDTGDGLASASPPPPPPSYVMAQCFQYDSTTFAIVVWSGTSNATVIENVQIPLTAGGGGCAVVASSSSPSPSSILFIVPIAGFFTGNATSIPLDTGGDTVTITVTENPIILMLGTA